MENLGGSITWLDPPLKQLKEIILYNINGICLYSHNIQTFRNNRE